VRCWDVPIASGGAPPTSTCNPSSSPRRAKTIHLTPRGRAIADKVETVSRRVRNDALAGLSAKDIETTVRVLQHVCHVLEGETQAEAA